MALHKNYGIKECNQFFLKERDNTICRGKTFNNFLYLPFESLTPSEQRFITKYEDTERIRRNLYNIYYGSVSNFRPVEAIRMYDIAKSNSILDPCAGWGGRCLGAIVKGIDYTGYDTNINLKEPYEKLIDKYNKLNKKITINFEDSSKADFSKLIYDTVLTSPPYYVREKYNYMPTYKNTLEFQENFLKPMLLNSYKHLQGGGTSLLIYHNHIMSS